MEADAGQRIEVDVPTWRDPPDAKGGGLATLPKKRLRKLKKADLVFPVTALPPEFGIHGAPVEDAEGRLAGMGETHGFRVDEQGQRVLWQDHVLPLTPVEYRLLKLLLSRPDMLLLAAVGKPCAVNPDFVLRRSARDADWPIIEYRD